MIALKVFVCILLFLLFSVAGMLFIPLRTRTELIFYEKRPSGEIQSYWIKPFFNIKFCYVSSEQIKFRIWLLFFPVVFKIDPGEFIRKKTSKKSRDSREKEHKTEETTADKDRKDKDKRSWQPRLSNLAESKDKIIRIWDENKNAIKSLFTNSLVYKLKYLNADIGLNNPYITGCAGGVTEVIKNYLKCDKIHINYCFNKSTMNFHTELLVSIRLYAIGLLALKLYKKKREEHHESK